MNERIIGKNIRKIRTQAGLTLTYVAEKAELTKSTLSKIETGQTSPPISTLIRIAKAIGVGIVDFFVDERKQPVYVLTRKNQGQIVSGDGSKFGYSYEALAIDKPDKYVEPFLLTINPCDPPGKFHHAGQEFIYVLSGCIEFTIEEETLRLKSGDSLFFDSGHIHKTQVVGKQPVRFLCMFIQDITQNKKKGK